MSSTSEHWTRCDADTCPRLDTCPYPNGYSDWSEAQPDQQNVAMLPHHDWKYVSFFKGIQRYLVVRVTVTGKEGFESRDIHQTNTRHF